MRPYSPFLASICSILAGVSLIQTAAAQDADIEFQCRTRIEREFARTAFAWDNLAKYELRKTKVFIVDDLPIEKEVGEYAATSLKAEALPGNITAYTFLLKRDLCLAENNIDLEGLIRLKVIEHNAEINGLMNEPAMMHYKQKANTFKSILSRETLAQEYLNTKLSFDPGAKAAKAQLRAYTQRKIISELRNTKVTTEPSSAEKVFDALKKRFSDSVKVAKGTVGYGNHWQNPDPHSIAQGTSIEILGIIDSLALIFGDENLPQFWRERLLLETDTDITFFNNGSRTTNQITTVKFKVGDSYLFARDTYSDFSDKSSNDCNQSSHCDAAEYRSVGFRWNALAPLKYRSNVYFEYDLIKLHGNKPFEADVIKQTSVNNPHWPLLRRLRKPEKENPGLLLGYIIRTGFIAQVADNVPQLFPFLRKSFGLKDNGKLELFGEARLFGSTVVTDDADSMDLEFGWQIRYPNKIVIGMKVTYSAEVGGHDDDKFKDGRNRTTGMVFVTIPLKEPEYLDDHSVEKEYSDKLAITKVEVFTKKFGEDIPAHFNTDEKKQKSMETGIDIAAAWGRFVYEIMLSQVFSKDTPLDQNVSSYQTARVAVKYELTPKLRVVAEGIGDNFENGHAQLGLGIQAKPLAGTQLEDDVDISISTMYYPTSSYCAIVRCNQMGALTNGLDLHRNWGTMIDVNKPFGIYKLTDWTGIKGEIGLQSRLYMKDLNFGYYSILFNAGLAHDGLGIRVGASPYGQDFNFGAPQGDRPFSRPMQGKAGPHSEKSMYFMWDLMKTYRYFFEKQETEKNKPLLTETTPDAPAPLRESQPSPIDLNKLPTKDRDNSIVYKWLAEIAGIWESGNRSEQANDLFETVPYLILNIAQHRLWNAKWALNNKGLKAPMIALEDLRRIYDPNQDFYSIELENDKALESVLRNTFSKHPGWKERIQAVGRETFSETLHCQAVAFEKLGNLAQAEAYQKASGYELPSWPTRMFNEAIYNESYCQ